MSEQWLAWASQGTDVDVPSVDFDGAWKNTLGSTMTLSVSGGELQGQYRTAVGAPGQYEDFALRGQVHGDLLAFTVDWGRYGSLTAWTGQHRDAGDGHPERIETMWLLVSNVNESAEPRSAWGAWRTGSNVFVRV